MSEGVDRDEVEAANDAFYAAYENADLDAMRALWLERPDTTCVHPGTLAVRGTPAIHRSWALVMAHTPYIQFFLTDVSISVLDDVAAVVCTENVLTADRTTDQDAFSGTQAVATNVFVRTQEGWRLWSRHASPVLSGRNHDEE